MYLLREDVDLGTIARDVDMPSCTEQRELEYTCIQNEFTCRPVRNPSQEANKFVMRDMKPYSDVDVPPVFGARDSKVIRLLDADEAGSVLVYRFDNRLNVADIDVLERPLILELRM